jgi:hypothetical protein
MPEKTMIGYCGNNCHLCGARSDDPAIRQKVVDGWKKFLHLEMYTVENIKCDGCRSKGKLADGQCKIRPCVMEKKLPGCGHCDDLLSCEKIERFIMHRYGFMLYSHNKIPPMSEEEYRLCIRQFDSLKNLTFMLIDAGKLPAWLKKY